MVPSLRGTPDESADEGADGLTGLDRRHLRRLAHPLKPVVQVGGAGVTDAVVAAVSRALDDHELIKLRIPADRDTRKSVAQELARGADAALAGLVGQIAILYRPAALEERRGIRLPSRETGRRRRASKPA